MSNPTPEQMRELAHVFHGISVRLGEYRFGNWSNLSSEQRSRLESAEWTILNCSYDFLADAMLLILQNANQSLNDVIAASEKIKIAVGNIKKADKVVTIATVAVTLGAAIMTGNPTAIAVATASAVETVLEEAVPS